MTLSQQKQPMPATDIHPTPRCRFRWRRAILLTLFLCLFLIVVAHQWWSAHVNRRLEAQIDEYRRQGQPVTLDDLRSPAIPEDQNAAIDLRAAADAIELSDEQRKFIDSLPFYHHALTDEQLAKLKDPIAANADALAKAHTASGKPGVDWDLTLESPILGMYSPDRESQKELVQLLTLAALCAHKAGDDRTAIQRMEDVFFIAQAMHRQPLLSSYLTAIGFDALACRTLLQIAHDLRITPTDVASAEKQRIQRLIPQLLDNTTPQKHYVRAMHAERMAQIDVVRLLASGRRDVFAKITNRPEQSDGGIGFASPVLRPWLLANGIVAATYTTQAAEAAASPTWPLAESRLPDMQKIRAAKIRYAWASLLLPPLDATLKLHYRALTDRHMAATALAIRLYAIDHDGKRPQSLNELVPAYLPAIPPDPFANDGGPIRYRPHETDPLLYSVGENGIDDQGSDKPIQGRWATYRWQQLDATYPLIPKPKPPEEPNQ